MGVEQVALSVASQSEYPVSFRPATFHRRLPPVPWETKVRFAIPQQEAVVADDGARVAAIIVRVEVRLRARSRCSKTEVAFSRVTRSGK